MKTIKFSENELEFLKNHYELELIDAENYVSEIKNILKKLGKELIAVEAEKPKKRRGRPPKAKQSAEPAKAPAVIKAIPKKKEAPKKKKAAVKPRPKKVKTGKSDKPSLPEPAAPSAPDVK